MRTRWRKITWALIIWVVIDLVWAVAGGGHPTNNCVKAANGGNLSTHKVKALCGTGSGIGAPLILLIGLAGVVVLLLTWYFTKPGRDCPVCGALVRRGQTQCENCGYDFAAPAADGSANQSGQSTVT